jgi:3-hydroxyisobutyrate dehydrogenase-like beta-hydroxyacid dehydrogenase
MNIAFLGLGNMGGGIAGCLLRAGHSLRVWNRTPEKTVAFARAGAVVCDSPAAAVEGVPLVVSSLMDDAAVRAVFGGSEGVIAKMAADAIHLATMTISPECADWLAEQHGAKGSRYVSGPVVGRPDVAAAGQLTEYLAGDSGAIQELKPVCSAFASQVIVMAGPASVANRQKLCVNFFIISQIEAMAECLTFAEKVGASKDLMAGFFDKCYALAGLKGYAKRLQERQTDGTGGFSLRGGMKDVGLMLDTARAAECPLDLATIIHSKMQECLALGLKDADWTAIQEATRARAGLR